MTTAKHDDNPIACVDCRFLQTQDYLPKDFCRSPAVNPPPKKHFSIISGKYYPIEDDIECHSVRTGPHCPHFKPRLTRREAKRAGEPYYMTRNAKELLGTAIINSPVLAVLLYGVVCASIWAIQTLTESLS